MAWLIILAVNMIEVIVVIFLAVIVFSVLYFGFRKTHFGLDFGKGLAWPLLLYREMVMIFAALLLLGCYGASSFEGAILNLSDGDIFWISLVVVYAVLVFSIVLAFCSRIFRIPFDLSIKRRALCDVRVKKIADAALISGVSVFLFSYAFLSYKHALLSSILSGGNLVSIRLANAYASGLPSQLANIMAVAAMIAAIFSSVYLQRKEYLRYFAYLLGAIFLATSPGDKAPGLMCIVISVLSYLSIKSTLPSFKSVFFSLFVYFPLMYGLTFFLASLQINELSLADFNIYLLNRLGVGQMSGVFETFSISRVEGDFFWHMIPFASFFADYVPYDKTLMMVVEGYDFDAMGVKNSLFVSEAYGIGGWTLVFLSPIIVGVSYALGMKFLFEFFSYFFGKSVAVIYAIPLYVLTSSLTGGFSSFPFFKGLILTIFSVGVIWIFYRVLNISLKRTR